MQFERDFLDKLAKGTALPSALVDSVCNQLGIDPTSVPDRNLMALRIASALESALWAVGKKWSLRVREGVIHILTDAESVAFQTKRFKMGVNKIRRSKKHVEQVDTSQLGENDLRRHDNEHRKICLALATLSQTIRDCNKQTAPSRSEKLAPRPSRVVVSG